MWYCTVGCLVTLALLVAPLAADAQPAGNVRRIGWLGLQPGDFAGPGRVEAFQQGLGDMGYVEGQNLVIEHRSAGGKAELLPGLAAELVRLPVEVLVTNGTPATRAAKGLTSTLPIVFANVANPVEIGLIASWAHPGGNLTGVASAGVEFMAAKPHELLKEVVPTATRIGILVDPDNPVYGIARTTVQAAAQAMKVDLYFME